MSINLFKRSVMIKSEKKLMQLRKVLDGGKHFEIEEQIGLLRDAEPFEGAILLLSAFYDKTSDTGLHLLISGFFNDLKERSVCNEVIEALRSSVSHSTRAMLASSCWQSGLDYSGHASALAEIYINGDYLTSLECFTVIDTCSAMIPQKERESIIKMLEKEIENNDKSKHQLTHELISILKE